MINNLPKNQKVLVCPLDWGLGHATRMIPVIRQLLENQNEVVIAADQLPLNLLKQEFPAQEFVRLPSYNILYSRGEAQVVSMLIQGPKLWREIIREHRKLKTIIKDKNIDVVISDNRFGCWNKKAKSIYVTHQVMVKMPKGLKFLEYPGYLIHRWFIKRYDECWIPDYEGLENLSGDLSHKYTLPDNTKFIGPLSRFNDFKTEKRDKNYDIVCVLSGPEPQRSLLEDALINQLKDLDYKSIIVRGKPGENEKESTTNIVFENHLSANDLGILIKHSKLVICRSGYSSIMDLVALNKKAILIPTPGQTEQEYLAEHLKNHELFTMMKQNDLDSLKHNLNNV